MSALHGKGRVKKPSRRKTWVYVPPKPVKADVEAKARVLVESVLKPLHIKSRLMMSGSTTSWTLVQNGTAATSTFLPPTGVPDQSRSRRRSAAII